jgi:glutaredoxin
MRRVVLYSRPSCGLCDEARSVLQAARTAMPFELQEVNVETEDALELEYGVRIPVVTIDGEERFEIAVEEGAFLDALRVEER